MTITVLDYLSGRGAPYLVLPSPQAASPEETAAAHDVSTDELVRTIAFRYRFGDAIAVVPWTRPVMLHLVREALDDPEARSLEPHELEGFANGCSPDSLPPLGLWLQAPMFVDVAVARLQQVVFAAGRASLLVCMQRTELFRDDPYAVAVLTEASHAEAEAAGIVAPRTTRELTEDDLLPVHVVEERRRSGGRDRTDVA